MQRDYSCFALIKTFVPNIKNLFGILSRWVVWIGLNKKNSRKDSCKIHIFLWRKKSLRCFSSRLLNTGCKEIVCKEFQGAFKRHNVLKICITFFRWIILFHRLGTSVRFNCSDNKKYYFVKTAWQQKVKYSLKV